MKTNDANTEKNLYHYIVENYIYDTEIEHDIIKHNEIKLLLKVVKNYHVKYKNYPTMATIINLLKKEMDSGEKVDTKILKLILDDTDYKKNMENNGDFWIKELEKHIKLYRENKKVLKEIEKLRNGEVEVDVDDDEIKENFLENTPKIKDWVYEKLPEFMKKTNTFEDRVKDMFLTNQIVVLSSLFDTVYSIYDDMEIYSNLFCFISAPQSSGKGKLVLNRDMLKNIVNDFDVKVDEKNKKSFVIPADSSNAAIILKLNTNDGVGLIFDTEGDVVSNNQKQDWGDYSTLTRKAGHHEIIETNRVEKFYRIEKPKLSIALTGTPNQVFRFIKDSEDGMISRFIFYIYDKKEGWRSPKPKTSISKTELFNTDFSIELKMIYEFFKNKNIYFSLSEKQWNDFDVYFSKELKKAHNFNSNDGLVKRGGLIAFRIMMVLSILRAFEKKDRLFNSEMDSIVCEDVDFEIGLELSKVYQEHGKIIYDSIDKNTDKHIIVKNDSERMFLELNDVFKRQNILELGNKYKISERTIGRLISSWKENGLIDKINKIEYRKKDI